jgi:threonine dehydrogenase-like Zn-dependent dehydrogenase
VWVFLFDALNQNISSQKKLYKPPYSSIRIKSMRKMKAAVFVKPGKIEIRQKPIPEVGPTDALVRITTTNMKPLVTHRFKLEDIEKAYDLFANQRDGVLKVAITP